MVSRRNVFSEGRSAFYEGIAQSSNPFDPIFEESKFDDWEEGWLDAKSQELEDFFNDLDYD